MGNDTKLFGAQVPETVMDAIEARLGYGEKSEYIREFARHLAYGEYVDDRTPLDAAIAVTENRIATLEQERQEITTELDRLGDELDRLNDERQRYTNTESHLDAALIALEDDLRRGMNVDPEAPRVDRVAREFDKTAEDVIDRLKQRNPDVPDHAFERATPFSTTPDWDGVSPDAIETPVENRECLYRGEV